MGWVVKVTLRQLYTRMRPGTHCAEGLVDRRAVMDVCGETSPVLGFEPLTVQPVAA